MRIKKASVPPLPFALLCREQGRERERERKANILIRG